jgi:hypothetical protein
MCILSQLRYLQRMCFGIVRTLDLDCIAIFDRDRFTALRHLADGLLRR